MKRGKLNDLISNLQSLTVEKQTKDVLGIIKSHESELVDLNIAQMDLQGIDADGKRLRAYRNPRYAAIKRQINPRGVTDLHLTGAFHREMFVDASEFPVEFGSRNYKSRRLQDQYGNIFGLTAENKEGAAKEILRPSVEDYYRGFLDV
jgi:hypothetical protein